MTPQFITPCYVQVDDKTKRKEVCLKLIDLGYEMDELTRKHLDVIPEFFQVSTGTKKRQIFVTSELGAIHKVVGRINCGTNIDLFLALAGMREDTDKGQWFTTKGSEYRTESWHQCQSEQMYGDNLGGEYRRPTAAEIIEHFKTKEK